MTSQLPRLRSFSAGVRLGIAALSIVLLSGLAASAVHMKLHYENRDEKPGFTLEDLEGAYHGVSSEAPLRAALERGHPEELGQAERDALMKWLDGDSLSTDYDNLDLGDDAPAEIIAFACLDCHSRSSEDAVGKTIPLEFWDDVAGLAISREIMPTPPSVLVASMHAHTISLATMSIAIAFLALMTSFPPRLVGWGICIMGVALAADFAGWWISRSTPSGVLIVVAAGTLYNGASAILLLGVLVDALRPPYRSASA